MWLIFHPNLLSLHAQTRERCTQRRQQVRWWRLVGWILAGSVGTGNAPAPLEVVQIASDVVHKQFHMSATPLAINVPEVRLGGVQLAGIKAGSQLAGRAPLSTMLKAARPQVIAGLKGDFFSDKNNPVGLHIAEEQVVKRTGSWSRG